MTMTVVRRIPTSEPVVSFTFDDGPHPDYTPRALSIMDRYRMKGTWFIIGELAAEFPGLLASIMDHGHDVATHSYRHIYLTDLDYNGVRSQLLQTKQVIQKQTGKFWPMFRPTYGAFNATVLEAAESLGYRNIVLWSVDPTDYEVSTDEIIDAVLAGLAPGAIILLHEVTPRTTEALPTIFQEMRERGFRSVPLSKLLAAEPVSPSLPYCRELRLHTPPIWGEDVEAVQVALAARGYDPGLIDCLYGPTTARAVSRFQAAVRQTPTGTVDRATYRALGINCPAGGSMKR